MINWWSFRRARSWGRRASRRSVLSASVNFLTLRYTSLLNNVGSGRTSCMSGGETMQIELAFGEDSERSCDCTRSRSQSRLRRSPAQMVRNEEDSQVPDSGSSSIEADELQQKVLARQILPTTKFEVQCARSNSDLIASNALEDVMLTLGIIWYLCICLTNRQVAASAGLGARPRDLRGKLVDRLLRHFCRLTRCCKHVLRRLAQPLVEFAAVPVRGCLSGERAGQLQFPVLALPLPFLRTRDRDP